VSPPEDDVSEHTEELGGLGAAAPVKLGPGALLADRYQIEASIGEGGSGQVFRAWDRVLGEPIALKILRPDRARERSWIKRLAREVKVARLIRHPNVCRVFELGHADGHWFITMELGTGGGLREMLRAAATAPRPLAERLDDARALSAGLAAIHAVGIIHRDVTPQNVLRMADGRLVLSDFGLAIEVTSNTTMHGGTPSYMPPETAMGGRADQRSDVWQLGAILHELVFGGRPRWERDGDRTVMAWPLPPGASPVEEELARLCRDCLAQNQEGRPATAMVVVGRLAAAELARPRTSAHRLALRLAGSARRHGRLIGFLVGALSLLTVARSVQVMSRPPLCRGASEKLDGVWDDATKHEVQRAFERSGRAYAGSTLGSVEHLLDRYLARWSAMYTDACEATHVRGEQSAEILDLRMSCLAERLDGVKALAALLTRADGEVVDNAVAAAGALGPLERCADQRLLRAVLPPPENAAARAEVARIRRGIADAQALHDAGNERLAGERLAGVVADARRAGYAPSLAEALALLGRIDAQLGQPEAGEAALKEAFLQAEGGRYDDLKANAATFLVFTAGQLRRFDEAEDWARQAAATLRRIGGHDQTRASLEMHVAEVRRQRGQNDEAIAHLQRALELDERAGASRGQLARDLNNIAVTLNDMRRADEALGYADRAIADLAEEVGAEHPLVGTFISNRGEILARLGRHAEARAAFERALAIEAPSYGEDSPNLAYPLHGLGDSHLAERQARAALPPLERALWIREARETDRTLVADTAFSLARALWDGGGDRARALRLGGEARDIYREQVAQGRLDGVNRWLEGRRATPARPPKRHVEPGAKRLRS
jgi:tetratricopeptide (TPR) repeat protein